MSGKKDLPCESDFEVNSQCVLCKELIVIPSEYVFAVSGSDGTIENEGDFVCFDGTLLSDDADDFDNRAEIWRDICRRKMQEAYTEFMEAQKMSDQGETDCHAAAGGSQ